MDKWWRISLLLCCYGLFKEYRPSEPFISPFLTGHWKNFTEEQVTEEIYPLGIYFYLFLLVIVFLLTDLLRYKPVLIIGAFAGIITWTLIIFGKTIFDMQMVELFYGIFMASEVAYYTYIYAKVDKEHYQKVTSHTRAAFLLGKASAGLSSQLFTHLKLLDYLELNYLTVSALILTTLVSLLLPSVDQSTYFHRYSPNITYNSISMIKDQNCCELKECETKKKNLKKKIKKAFHYLYSDLKDAYTNLYVIKWSIWWCIATCGYLQITTYCQLLWEDINKVSAVELYNGLVEFIYSVLGAVVAFSIGFSRLSWHRWGELVLGILTLAQGGCLISEVYLTNLYFAYAVHIIYIILYHSAITILSSEVANHIRKDSYALIFGINTFFAVFFQSILTLIVVNYYKYRIRTQIYGYYHLLIGIGYLIIAVYTLIKLKRKNTLQQQ